MKLHRVVFIFAMIALLLLPVAAVQADPLHPQDAPPISPVASDPVDFADLVNSLPGLAGVAALITLIINVIGKRVGFVKDGQSATWSAGLNLLALIGLFVVKITGHANLIPMIDEQAGALAVALSAILAYIFQLFVSRKAHDAVLAGMPVIGKSFSGRSAGEQETVIAISGFGASEDESAGG